MAEILLDPAFIPDDLAEFFEIVIPGRASDVFTIPPSQFPGSHFAVMPSELAKRCILAGTSPQACERCGAPWGRVVERTSSYNGSRADDAVYSGQAYNHAQSAPRGPRSDFSKSACPTTLGFAPTCKCANAGSARCVVLDPFCGAGTTLLVADRLGRDGIGVELNPDYAAMARERIRSDAPLFADIADGAA